MLKFPNAKLNLGLRILNKRPDGFHNIESIFYPVSYCDALEIIPSTNFSFKANGNHLPQNSWDNLCVKAYELLRTDLELPQVNIFLHKAIPIGAGLGGGSADAAFTLMMLNELFDLKLTELQLEKYAAQLGSDCVFFIRNKPALVTGRGDILQPIAIDLKGYSVIIATPAINVNTLYAYRLWDELYGDVKRKPGVPLAELVKYPLTDWKNHLENDFEKVIFNEFQELKQIKTILYGAGAIYASLSGSGSALFGIFMQGENLIDNVTKIVKRSNSNVTLICINN